MPCASPATVEELGGGSAQRQAALGSGQLHAGLVGVMNLGAAQFIGHVRQIAELVRTRRYLAGAGPLGRSIS
jgi:hypothetical protein